MLEGDIDSLEFLKIIKRSLKILKAILGATNTLKNNIKSKLKPMAITNLTARANFNRRKADYWRRRVRSGVKNIEGRIETET